MTPTPYRRSLEDAAQDLAAASESLAQSVECAPELFPVAELHAAVVLLEWVVSEEIDALREPPRLRCLTTRGSVDL